MGEVGRGPGVGGTDMAIFRDFGLGGTRAGVFRRNRIQLRGSGRGGNCKRNPIWKRRGRIGLRRVSQSEPDWAVAEVGREPGGVGGADTAIFRDFGLGGTAAGVFRMNRMRGPVPIDSE